MEKVTDLTARLAAPIVEEQGCSLWDVEYVKEAGTWYLRVLIDKEGGVDILDCENISRALSDLLDEADPIEGSYTLEIGSAGAERVLKRPADFQRYLNSPVLVKLYKPVDGRGIPRHPDRLQRGQRFSHRGPQRHCLYLRQEGCGPVPPASGILICYPCLKKRRIK